MPFTKITETDLQNKGVIGLPDTPGLSTTEMQEKFDEIALDVLCPKHNGLIDELSATSAAANVGALNVGGTASTVQDELDNKYSSDTVDQLLSNKVDTEPGKGLSTNDFSDAYRDKLNGIEDGANKYVLPKGTQSTIGGVMGDGSTFTIDENGVGHAVGGGGGGTADYNALINKPVINGNSLSGNHDSEYYGLLRPYLVITSEAGSTVTISKGGVTITATQKSGSTTEWEVCPTSYGTWLVSSDLPGADVATSTITIDAVKTYAITVEHITATITATYQSGGTCTCSKGSTTYTATSNPEAFTVRSMGNWIVACTYDGLTKTQTVPISADQQSESVSILFATITVTYGNAFRGTTITCTNGDTVYSKTAPSGGNTVSFTVPTTGSWVVSGTVSGTPYQQTVVVSSMTSYSTTLNVFSATVTITFPYSNGATCKLSDGVTELVANTSPMAFNVPNVGTWVATCTLDGLAQTESFSITTDGQTESHTFTYGTINLTYDNEFRGLSLTCSQTGGSTITKTAPSGANSMSFYPDATGTWEITGTYSGQSYSTGEITVSLLSTAVSANLQTYIIATVTLHGAVGATISYVDVTGLQTKALDENGECANVVVKCDPSNPYVSFVDTNKSKLPEDLTKSYFKRVEITDALTDIYIMPDNSLYWYGYEDSNCEDCTSANGWSATGFTIKTPTHNSNDIAVPTSGGTETCAVGNKIAVSSTKAHAVTKTITLSSSYGVAIRTDSTKNIMANTSVFQTVANTMQHLELDNPSNYISVGAAAGRAGNVYALWYDTTTPTTPTYYSAAYDMLYIKDSSNNIIPIAVTDAEGKAYDALLPSGTYTIYSSVAKNPDSLSDAYSKTVTITNATSDVYVMPDNALYWYGYISSNCEVLSTANGWTYTNYTFDTPTFNKNYVSLNTTTSSRICGIGTKSSITPTTGIKTISKGVRLQGSEYGVIANAPSKTPPSGTNYTLINSTSMKTYTLSATTTDYYIVQSSNNRASECYAMWYE